jgi:hypothetical protein
MCGYHAIDWSRPIVTQRFRRMLCSKTSSSDMCERARLGYSRRGQMAEVELL